MASRLTRLTFAILCAAAAPAAAQDCSAPNAPIPCGNGVATNSSPPAPVVVAVPGYRNLQSAPAAHPTHRPSVPPRATIVRPPHPRGDLSRLINVADYPESALQAREEGTVRFMLDVGPDGRVGACTITQSSGSSALDAATCQLLRRRARFTPASDSNGNPASSRIADAFTWRVPLSR